jgi:hypothetical protein
MKDFKLFYFKYKRVFLPSLFGLLAVFLIFMVILPQISAISKLTSDLNEASNKVQILKSSLDVISSQNEAEVDSKLGIVTEALPTAKDILRIFNSLNSAAASSNTTLREFSVEVGGVYGREAEIKQDLPSAPSMEVVARVDGDVRSISKFSDALYRKFPLSEISTIDSAGDSTTFQVNFFYKPVNFSILSKQDKVSALSAQDVEFINKLSAENSR